MRSDMIGCWAVSWVLQYDWCNSLVPSRFVSKVFLEFTYHDFEYIYFNEFLEFFHVAYRFWKLRF